MDRKLNSYQKLKLENEKLKLDIFNLIRKEAEIEGVQTKVRYLLMYESNDAVLFGTKLPDDAPRKGLLAQLKS